MNARNGVRVLVVDDHEVIHWGFKLVLTRQPWVDRCLAAATPDQALDLAARYTPHVALVDLFLGNASGAELSGRLRTASPSTRVLLMSGAGSISRKAAEAAGASGFVPKGWPATEVADAVRRVASGEAVFPGRAEAPGTPLSARERDVLVLMAQGSTNREIATVLHLSPHTVKEHASSLYRTLDVRNRAEAVARAERLGLVGR